MNKLRQLLIEVYKRKGEDAVIELVEEAGLEISLYESFFEQLREDMLDASH